MFSNYITHVLIFFSFCCLIGLFRFLISRNKTTFGSAKWLATKAVQKLVNSKNNGYVIDGVNRISHEQSTRNITTIAPTGGGKSWGQVVPNLLRMKTDYSIVVTDPSGDLFKATGSALQSVGVNVMIYQPFDEDNTVFFNPIESVTSLSEAMEIAETILIQQSGSQSDKFWITAPGLLLGSLINFCVDISSQENDYRSFDNIFSLLRLPYVDLITQIETKGSEDTKRAFLSYRESSENTRGNIVASLMAALGIFLDPKIQKATNNHDLDFSVLRDETSVLFVVIPEDKITYARGLMALFYKKLFNFLFQNINGKPVYILLDEFGNMRIPDFQSIITQSRKKNISISIMLQSLEQLKDKYPGQFQTIFEGGCQTKIIYPGLGNETCKIISQMIGNKTEIAESVGTNQRKTEYGVSRALIMPEEIRTLKKHEALVLIENNAPFKINLKPAYDQKELMPFLALAKEKEYQKRESSSYLETVAIK